MIPIILGTDQETKLPVTIDRDTFRTHLHLLGGTGSGKTSLIRVILQAILLDPHEPSTVFLIDPVGNLSKDLLLWMVDEDRCPLEIRERLVYIEPARPEFVLPFNPLMHCDEDDLYYQVARAVDIVLRAWASQNIEEMPRLRHWTFAAFFAVAAMGYPIAMCRYLLRPGSDEHKALLHRLPSELQNMWSEILNSRGGNEAVRLLESTRNRLAPFFDSGILRRMFSSVQSRFDVRRFIRDRRIVILNLAPSGLLDQHSARAIGGLAVNEIIQTAMSMSPQEVNPTYLFLDEFQHWVSMDLYDALPLVRQLGLRLILSHQSLSQLIRGEIDLTGIIWQARSRIIFANDADDADRMANEFTTLTYDPFKIKKILKTQRQKIIGHRKVWLQSTSHTTTQSQATDKQQGQSSATAAGLTRPETGELGTKSNNQARTTTTGQSEKRTDGTADSEGLSETLVPIHQDFEEISSETNFTFDEQKVDWGKRIRTKPTGEAFAKFKDDPKIYDLALRYQPVIDTPEQREQVEELVQKNFESECFVTAARIEQEAEEMRLRLLGRSLGSSDQRPDETRPRGLPDKSDGKPKQDDDPYR